MDAGSWEAVTGEGGVPLWVGKSPSGLLGETGGQGELGQRSKGERMRLGQGDPGDGEEEKERYCRFATVAEAGYEAGGEAWVF